MTALARLEEAVNYGLEEIGDLRVGGIISEVAPSYYRIAGLSHFLKLGECVGLQHDGQTQLGEVVRIDAAASTVKSFDATVAAGIGDRAFRIGPLTSRRTRAGRAASSMRSAGRSTGKASCCAANMRDQSNRRRPWR